MILTDGFRSSTTHLISTSHKINEGTLTAAEQQDAWRESSISDLLLFDFLLLPLAITQLAQLLRERWFKDHYAKIFPAVPRHLGKA